MPNLDAEYYVGVNFIRAFRAALDPDTDRLFLKATDQSMQLEVAGLDAGTENLSSAGIADATESERLELRRLLDDIMTSTMPKIGRTHNVTHSIDMETTRPIKQRYYHSLTRSKGDAPTGARDARVGCNRAVNKWMVESSSYG